MFLGLIGHRVYVTSCLHKNVMKYSRFEAFITNQKMEIIVHYLQQAEKNDTEKNNVIQSKMHARLTRSFFRTRIGSSYEPCMESILLRKSCTVDMTCLNTLIVVMLTN